MKDRRVDRVVDHHRSTEFEAELTMLLEAVGGLHDRRDSKLLIDLHDATVGPVVETAVRPDRPVDTMNHSDPFAREPLEPAEVEVERVVEQGRRPPREPVRFYLEATALQL